MNKKFAWVLLLFFVITGCSKNSTYEKVYNYYQSLETYSGNYKYEVDFGGVFEYYCTYLYENGTGAIQIYAPEELTGIAAVTDETGTNLVYEDITVRTYLPENKEFSPVSALHGLIKDLKTLEIGRASCRERV